MKVGDLVMHKTVHADQEKSRPLIVIKVEFAWRDDFAETLTIVVLDPKSGGYYEWYDWQLEVISEAG